MGKIDERSAKKRLRKESKRAFEGVREKVAGQAMRGEMGRGRGCSPAGAKNGKMRT